MPLHRVLADIEKHRAEQRSLLRGRLAAFRHAPCNWLALAIIGKRNPGGRYLWVTSCVLNRDVFVTYGYKIDFQLNFYCTITSFVC